MRFIVTVEVETPDPRDPALLQAQMDEGFDFLVEQFETFEGVVAHAIVVKETK